MIARLLSALSLVFAVVLPAHSQTTFRMAYITPPSVWGPIVDRYAQHVGELTNAQIKIQGIGGAQLGKLAQNYAGLKSGQIDMMLADTGTLGLARGGRDLNAMFAPYAFRDQAHFRAFIASRTFLDMIAVAEKEGGFKYVGYVSDRTPRQLTTSNTRVTRPEDLKGLRIRVPETPTTLAVFKAWGAAPTPIPAAEMYMALKQGVVDGQENGFDAIAGAKLYEVQKYAIRIDYVHSGLMVLMAADKWNRLTPAQQKALQDACVSTEAWATKWTSEVVAKAMDVIRNAGIELVEPDLIPFRKIAAEALARLDGEVWAKGTLERIESVK